MRNKKNILIILLFLILIIQYSILNSQDTWVQTYRPFQQPFMEDSYSVEDVLVTQDGGYVISGSYELIGEEPWEYEHWGFLMKTDCDGNILWAVNDSVYFMSENGYTIDFTETLDGGFLTIGYQGFGGNRYMIKRDSQGNREWAIPYNTDFGVYSMKTTNDGNIILGGRSEYNAALRKITPDGETLWTNIIDVDSSIAYSICQANDGGYLLTGINYTENDILVIKSDDNGDSLWTRTFDGLDGNERGNCIIETNDGNVLIAGIFQTSSYDTYGLLSKLTSDGNIIFCNQYENWHIRSCLEDIDNDYVIYSGHAMLKTNDNGDTLWCNGIPYWGYYGDRSFQRLEDGFLCVNKDDQYAIQLTKTDTIGQVTEMDEYTIVSNSKIKLKNYPNPFNPITTIVFELPFNIRNPIIEIFNIKGQLIDSFTLTKNQTSLQWNAECYSSGIYFYIIKKDKIISKICKMTLIK